MKIKYDKTFKGEEGIIDRILLIVENISRQKQMESKLKESEDRFRSIAENMADWIWEIDADGYYTYCSNRVEAILGYSPNEIIGKTPFDFICPEDKTRVGMEFEEYARTKKTFTNLENWNFTKDGRRICLLTRGTPIIDKNGNYCGYRGVDSDITDSRKAMDELKTAKEFAESLLETTNVIVLTLNSKAEITSFNRYAEELTGYKKVDVIDKNWFNLFIPQRDKENIPKVFKDVLKNMPKVFKHENSIVIKNGEERIISWNNSVLRNSQGNIIGVLSIGIDITENRNSEEALKSYQQRLALHIEQTPLAAIDWDLNFQVASWNQAAEKMFGYSYNEALGKHAVELLVPEKLKIQINEIWSNLLNKTGGNRSTNENITKDGKTIFCDWYNTSIIDEDGNVIGVSSLVMDITKRKRAEEELKEAKVESEIANNTKSMFLANMSHELRTPLNAILGFGQLLELEQNNLNEQQIEFLEHIKHAGNHLLEMVNDILDLSKIESGRFKIDKKSFNLSKMLSGLPKTINSLLSKKNIELIVNITLTNEIIYADEVRLKQVLYNLLSNAIKFTDSGKKIGIRAMAEANEVVIEVWDEGRGINETDLEKVFAPFEQVGQDNPQGTGLGLAISRNLINLLGGTLTVYSEVNKGSHFIIRLPDLSVNIAEK